MTRTPPPPREPHPTICLARHGIAVPRGQSPAAGARGGRFGRMFGHLPSRDPGPDAIESLALHLQALTAAGAQTDNPIGAPLPLPAGFTYLAQFIDHDITFDPTSKLQRDNDPAALVNFRTPRLDLDSLYGSGPADQPYLYDWSCQAYPGVKLLVGTDPPPASGTDPPNAALDLPRNAQGRALIGDARNDENLIVSQLHLLFITFHNRVVDLLAARERSSPGVEILEQAQRLVRWHYQWIVVHDVLPRIIGDDVRRDVLPPPV
ncbi:MAG: peroxidase family protein, partial [Solirubrobacteraceae bacterium]